MTHICPECGAEQPIDVARCRACGALMVPQEEPSDQFTLEDIFNLSFSTIILILVAMGVPCLVGLICFLLGR